MARIRVTEGAAIVNKFVNGAEIGEGDAVGDIDERLAGLVYTMTVDGRRLFNPAIVVTNRIVVVYDFTKTTLPIL